MEDGSCLWDDECCSSMVVYELVCKNTGKSYIGKTQQTAKIRTLQHFYDVWKVIETGRKKFGENWFGTGGCARADAFAKHFAQQCRECPNSNAVRAKLKRIVEVKILWQGDRIRCMKSSRTMQCRICMVERIEILDRFKHNKHKTINDNSDIFSSCKCFSRFHKFTRKVTPALMTRMTQKKVSSTRHSKQKRSRFSFSPRAKIRLSNPVTPTTPSSISLCSEVYSPEFFLGVTTHIN